MQSITEKPDLEEGGYSISPKKDPMHQQAARHDARRCKALPAHDELGAHSSSGGRHTALHTLHHVLNTHPVPQFSKAILQKLSVHLSWLLCCHNCLRKERQCISFALIYTSEAWLKTFRKTMLAHPSRISYKLCMGAHQLADVF